MSVLMRHRQISGFPSNHGDPYHRWSPAVTPRLSCCSWWEPAFPESNKSAPQIPDRCPTRENSLLCHWPKHKHTLYSKPTGALHTKVLLFYLNSQVIEDFGRPGIQRGHQVASASWEEDSGNDTEVVTARTPMRFIQTAAGWWRSHAGSHPIRFYSLGSTVLTGWAGNKIISIWPRGKFSGLLISMICETLITNHVFI